MTKLQICFWGLISLIFLNSCGPIKIGYYLSNDVLNQKNRLYKTDISLFHYINGHSYLILRIDTAVTQAIQSVEVVSNTFKYAKMPNPDTNTVFPIFPNENTFFYKNMEWMPFKKFKERLKKENLKVTIITKDSVPCVMLSYPKI